MYLKSLIVLLILGAAPFLLNAKDAEVANTGEIVITVMKSGEIRVNKTTFTREQLLDRLKRVAAIYPNQQVILRGEEETKFDHIMTALDVCKAAGVWNIAFVADTAASAVKDPIALFDGKNLDAWRGYKMDAVPKGWAIENGLLYCDGASKTDLVTKQEFGNFELDVKWKTEPKGNSGILILADETAKQIWNHAPEIQIFDASPTDTGLMHQAGALYDLYPAKPESLKPAGEWNLTKITVKDGAITVVHNGVTVCSVKVGSEEWNTKVAASKFGKFERFAKNPKGLIGLQDHGHKTWFESIIVRPL